MVTRSDIEACFRTHRASVYRWARLLCAHDEAIDVVQETFLRMLRHPPETRSVPGLLSWLRRTTQRIAVDRWRARVRRPVAEQLPDVPDPCEPRDPEAGERVQAAIALLTDAQRIVLLAHVADGLTFQQVADELGISPSTAKTHYTRALQALREAMPNDQTRRVS